MNCEVGTIVAVSDLFSSHPVRQEHLRSKRGGEVKKVQNLLTEYCLLMDVTSFRLEALPLASFDVGVKVVGVIDRIAFLFGPMVVQNLEHVQVSEDDVEIEGYLPSSKQAGETLLRSAPDRRYVFINRRPVDSSFVSKMVNTSVRRWFASSKKRYPFVLLNIQVPRSQIDVNVEPNKRIAMLRNEGTVKRVLEKMLAKLYPARDIREALTPVADSSKSSPLFEHALSRASQSSPSKSSQSQPSQPSQPSRNVFLPPAPKSSQEQHIASIEPKTKQIQTQLPRLPAKQSEPALPQPAAEFEPVAQSEPVRAQEPTKKRPLGEMNVAKRHKGPQSSEIARRSGYECKIDEDERISVRFDHIGSAERIQSVVESEQSDAPINSGSQVSPTSASSQTALGTLPLEMVSQVRVIGQLDGDSGTLAGDGKLFVCRVGSEVCIANAVLAEEVLLYSACALNYKIPRKLLPESIELRLDELGSDEARIAAAPSPQQRSIIESNGFKLSNQGGGCRLIAVPEHPIDAANEQTFLELLGMLSMHPHSIMIRPAPIAEFFQRDASRLAATNPIHTVGVLRDTLASLARLDSNFIPHSAVAWMSLPFWRMSESTRIHE